MCWLQITVTRTLQNEGRKQHGLHGQSSQMGSYQSQPAPYLRPEETHLVSPSTPFQLVKPIPIACFFSTFLISFLPTFWPFSVIILVGQLWHWSVGFNERIALHRPPVSTFSSSIVTQISTQKGGLAFRFFVLCIHVFLYYFITLWKIHCKKWTVKAWGCLYSVCHDFRWGKSDPVWLLAAQSSAVHDITGGNPVCNVYTEKSWQQH